MVGKQIPIPELPPKGDNPRYSLPILCLDFDGVIHDYTDGWKHGAIYGFVTNGFWPWAIEAAKYFRLVVYSSRSKYPENIVKMQAWLEQQWLTAGPTIKAISPPMPNFEFVHEKPPAFLTIDDRGLTFRGDWAEFDPAKLRAFRPWMQDPEILIKLKGMR